MKRYVLMLALLAAPACAPAPPDEAPLAGESAPALRADAIDALKQQIRAIALANQTRTDNLPQVAAQLRPLIEQLVAEAPPRTPQQTLDLLEGPWYALWSNLGYGPVPPDLRRIFQVVTKRGHYYNLSQSTVPFLGTFIGALRGAYAQVPDGFAIRFTRNGTLRGTLVGRTGPELVSLAASIESGATPILPLPGPIGISGKLTTIYVDQDLRIAGGEQTPVFDDNGQVRVPGQYDLLFVLDRQVGPVR